MDIIIDLLNSNRDKKNLGLEWNVALTEPKGGLLQKLAFISKHQHIEKQLHLTIDDVKIADELVCDKDNLFSIVYAGKEYAQSELPILVDVENEKTPFQVFLSQQAVQDCKESQQKDPKIYNISASLVLKDSKDVVIDTKGIDINVKFATLDIKPTIKIELDEDKIQYNAQLGIKKIGNLVAWIDESFSYTPSVLVDLGLALYQGSQKMDNVLSFDNGEIKKYIEIKPSRKHYQEFPIYLDFNHISNPIESELKLSIQRTMVQSMAYSPEIKERKVEFDEVTILKDEQGTELAVKINDLTTNSEEFVVSSQSYNIPEVNFVPLSGMMAQVSIDLMNIATDSSNSRAGLWIKNFEVNETILGDVRLLDDEGQELHSLVDIQGMGIDELNSNKGLFIRNGKNSKTTLYVSFDPSHIADIVCKEDQEKDYHFQVEFLVTFDYCENKDGVDISEVEVKEFKLPLIWNLYLEPNPEWLCVDFGTSAIVCKYHNTLIDLRKQKEKVFKKDYKGFTDDVFEIGTPFLSSDIVFHNVEGEKQTSLCSQVNVKKNVPYNQLAVCLSPTSSSLNNDFLRQLPCLKILVGNEFLPLSPDYMTFQYPKLEDGKVVRVEAKDTKNDKDSLLRIETIFKEVYHELFRYFIKDVNGFDLQKLNKLVLTYPNTYTPLQLNALRSIASSVFPNIREGYLRFVSESDAVAAYYIDHWSELNPDRNINEDETILVYDMGAGTLDVTILKKYRNGEGKIEVDVLGRIGSGKAGNYLDFAIADIAYKNNFDDDRKVVSTRRKLIDLQTLQDRVAFKQIIKSEIKPNLMGNDTLAYLFRDEYHSINANEITENDTFKNLISSMTKGVIIQLTHYMGKDRLDVDTVILSGRSCRLQLLKDALRESIAQCCDGDKKIIDFASDDASERAKISVVEGAMAQVGKFSNEESEVVIKSKRLYASYGLIYQVVGGLYHYEELLNHNDMPYGNDIFESKDMVITGTASAPSLHLVQTYLSPSETEKHYNAKDYEFISEMDEYDMANFGNVKKLKVRIRLDQNNNISLFVNNRVSKGNAPKGVDLTSIITKRSIWPVTISENK